MFFFCCLIFILSFLELIYVFTTCLSFGVIMPTILFFRVTSHSNASRRLLWEVRRAIKDCEFDYDLIFQTVSVLGYNMRKFGVLC